MVKTSTLAVMLVTGLFGAVLSASSSVAREIRSGTALAVLSKPVGRARFILGKYVGLSGALMLLLYTNLVACLLASRMAYDAYGSADTFSFAIYCLGGLLTAFVAGGFLNYFLQVRFVITTVIAVVILTTAMFAIILATEAETTGAGADPRVVDWRLISASDLDFVCGPDPDGAGAGLLDTARAAANPGDLLRGVVSRVDVGLAFFKPGGGRLVVGLDPLHRDAQLAELLAGRCAGRGRKRSPPGTLAKAFGYLVGYVGATLSVALWLFEDRELT